MIEEKRLKRMLRECAGKAEEAELHAALTDLDQSFNAWQSGEINSFELSDRVHTFHDTTAREIWKTYNMGGPLDMPVAWAIHQDVLAADEIQPELLTALGDALASCEELERREIRT